MSTLLPCIEIETATPVSACVIWLHGLGADGHDFAPIVPELSLPQHLALRFLFPHAPSMPVTVNGGYVMPAWYDISHPSLEQIPDEPGIRQSVQAVTRLIDQQVALGVHAQRIVLAGFSQGGVIALHSALRYAKKLAGVIALSTYLPCPDSLDTECRQTGLPIFVGHGLSDTVVPVSLCQQAQQKLAALGCVIDPHTYHMAHAVCAEEIRDVAQWLKGVLMRPP